jgi:hypothetical protein
MHFAAENHIKHRAVPWGGGVMGVITPPGIPFFGEKTGLSMPKNTNFSPFWTKKHKIFPLSGQKNTNFSPFGTKKGPEGRRYRFFSQITPTGNLVKVRTALSLNLKKFALITKNRIFFSNKSTRHPKNKYPCSDECLKDEEWSQDKMFSLEKGLAATAAKLSNTRSSPSSSPKEPRKQVYTPGFLLFFIFCILLSKFRHSL